MTCRNLCQRYKIKGNTQKGVSVYALGIKRCQKCSPSKGSTFLKWDGVFCPCCGYRLATKPKSTNGRANLVIKRI